MRVNEREIVRVGIINYFNNNREAESLCKRVCKGTAPHNHTYTQTSSNTPHFAQQFAQLTLNLFLICIYVQHNAQTNWKSYYYFYISMQSFAQSIALNAHPNTKTTILYYFQITYSHTYHHADSRRIECHYLALFQSKVLHNTYS